MLRTPSQLAVIDTHTPSGLIRAHLHAIRNGEISLMTGNATPRLLADILTQHPRAKIYSDRAAQLNVAPTLVIPVEELPEPAGLPENLPPATPIAFFYTSGSTGQPQCSVKTWGTLHGEAVRVASALGVARDGKFRVAATTPLEHMYGYMFGFLIPCLHNLSISPRQVVYPADLTNFLTSSEIPAWIVTTPTHLRLYVEGSTRFQNVARVICGAAPLDADLVTAAVRTFGAPITEFYGSTETGAIAIREWRDEHPELWTCLPGVTVSADEQDQTFVSTAHFEQPLPLADLLELHGTTRFRVRGRATDLVKIGGKRASIADLNRRLIEAPGVRDGIFYMPEDAGELSRLAAFLVLQEDTTQLQVMDYLRAHLDAVFLPRPLFEVPALPRNAVGKLSREAMREFYQTCLRSRRGDASVSLFEQPWSA